MSLDDEFGGFLDRESVLAGGVPARRANTILFLIENRAAHLMARSRQTVQPFLSQEAVEERELAFLEAFALGSEPPVRPKVQDLERYAPQWAPLVPRNPRVQAAVAHRLGEKYEFTREATPGIRAALGLDDAAVRQAYERLFRQPLDGIYAAQATPVDRLRWAWAALAGWLENLPPFWTAYSLTITETVGVTILALPIALAGIGPLAGVVLLVVLGLVNVLTIAYVSEAVARNGTIRYGSGFIGRVVDDYLGRAGSVVLSLGIFVLCFLVLQVFYIGFSTALEGATRVPAVVWVVLLFLVGLYFLRRESLSATVASALVVGAVNVVLVVVLSVVAFTRVETANLLHMEVPLIGGRPFDPEILGLVFGVVLTAFFGHLSVSSCARVVLERDPSARSLILGTVAAQLTAIFLYCIFVLGVNGAVAPEVLSGTSGTALDPLADRIGPIVYLLGSVFVVLGMGMGSIQYSLFLFSLVRERLPSVSRPTLALPRRQGVLLFRGRRNGLRLGVVYLGLRGGEARFRLDVELDGKPPRRVESSAAASGRWEVLGENGDPSLLASVPELRDRRGDLSLEILAADGQQVRLQATSSMRLTYEGTRDTAGLDMAGVFELPDSQAGLVAWILRQGGVSLREAAEHAGQDEDATRTLLDDLVKRGFVVERPDLGGQPRFEARLATRRGRQGAAQLRQALDEGGPPPGSSTSRSTASSGIPRSFERLLSGGTGRFALGVSPVVAAFLVAEWLLLTDAGSFTGLLGFVGALVVPILGGIFPVLLLLASRRQGERVPTAVYRFLGNPVLLVGIYAVFLASIFLHGLVIWTDPLQRVLALATSVVVVAMTLAMRGAFARRTVIELRQETADGDDERAFFSVVSGGRPAAADVRLEYPEGDQRRESAAGEVPDFSRLQQATFRLARGEQATTLKIWAHRISAEGNSEGMDGLLSVSQGGEPRVFDLKLSGGQVVLPASEDELRVEITPPEQGEAKPGEHA